MLPDLSLAIETFSRRRPDLVAHVSTPIDVWLAQFDDDADRLLALRLLTEVRFFPLAEVRRCLRALHDTLRATGVDLDGVRYTSFAEGKSGGLVQYFYRTSNFLHHARGVDWTAIGEPPETKKGGPPEVLVIVDDTIGTGREAAWYFNDRRADLARWRRRFFFAMVGFREGLEALAQASPEVEVRCFETHEKLFDARHTTFTEAEKAQIKDFLVRYGERVYPRARYGDIASPFGYRDGQALLAYFYNTPSNTLPIFWSVENGWKPVLQRFDSYNVPMGAV